MNAAIVHGAEQTTAHRVLVIAGSVRARRIAPQVAEWVARVGREAAGAQFEVIDLKDWPLPMSEEPGIPAIDDYVCEHTRAWSQKGLGSGCLRLCHASIQLGLSCTFEKRARSSLQRMGQQARCDRHLWRTRRRKMRSSAQAGAQGSEDAAGYHQADIHADP